LPLATLSQPGSGWSTANLAKEKEMSTISTIHGLLSNSIWLFFLILGLWGVFRALRRQDVDGSYLGALVIGEGLYLLQGILGGILWSGGLLAPLGRPQMHVLYGAFALVFLPFVYLVWLKGDNSNRAQWVLSLAALFLFGIALRAIGTGI
jgi:heme A synthase